MRLLRPEPAAQLAALRIVVPAILLASPEVRGAVALAGAPPELRVAPEGLGWLLTWVPVDPTVARVAQVVCVFSALCALVGLRARLAFAALGVSGFYVLALGQLSGAVWHDMHLLWMCALLAASPCDEALAFDRCGQPPAPDSVRVGGALTAARLILGAVYFFPGAHKLATSGLDWALSDNLRNQLWWKWAQNDVVLALRVDHLPALLHAGALFVLAFELSFPVLALMPRARPWLAAAGLLFHLTASYALRIPFISLWATYVVLLDPSPVLRRLRLLSEPATARTADEPWRSTLLVAAALGLGIVVQGVRGQMRAYPFACYPTFEWMVGPAMPDLRIEVETVQGERLEVPHARDARGLRTQRQWGEIFSLVERGGADPARLRAYLAQAARREPARSIVAQGTTARFVRIERSVIPEERGIVVRQGPVLGELTLPP